MYVNSNDINLARILKTYNYQNIFHIKRMCMHMFVYVCVYIHMNLLHTKCFE